MKAISRFLCISTLSIGCAACGGGGIDITIDPPPALPGQPQVTIEGQTKRLVFSWAAVNGADHYQLMENPDGHSGFTQVGDNIPAGTLTVNLDIAVHLFDWVNAQYIVEACNDIGCGSSDVLTVTDVMLDTIGYFKASNTDPQDIFGVSVALSADGSTLAVGSADEDSNATGVNGDENDNSARRAGAVYVFRRDGSTWRQEAYVKASNTKTEFQFGRTVALSADGGTLAVGSIGDNRVEDLPYSGSVSIFRFDGTTWSEQANLFGPSSGDGTELFFGCSIALSADGNTLAVGEVGLTYNYYGLGAAYIFRYDGETWTRLPRLVPGGSEQYSGYAFGSSVSLSADGNLLAVGSPGDPSGATGINGDQTDTSVVASGAVVLYRFDGSAWEQHAFIKASNTGQGDRFGQSVSLSDNGDVLGVGAWREDSAATGINGDQSDDSRTDAGAAYVFRSTDGIWQQEVYIKVLDACFGDRCDDPTSLVGFGQRVAMSGDGQSLAVVASVDDVVDSGAVSVFEYDGNAWSQRAYAKASNQDWSPYERGVVPRLPTEPNQYYDWLLLLNWSLSISGDGQTLAFGAILEASGSRGIGGDQTDVSAEGAGAVYVY